MNKISYSGYRFPAEIIQHALGEPFRPDITIDGATYDDDVIIRLSDNVEKRHKRLSKDEFVNLISAQLSRMAAGSCSRIATSRRAAFPSASAPKSRAASSS